MSAQQVVGLLNELVTGFDEMTEKYAFASRPRHCHLYADWGSGGIARLRHVPASGLAAGSQAG